LLVVINRLKLLLTVHRELLFHLALKNLKIQYKYAILGFLWAFFVPLCMAMVFWVIFTFLFSRPEPPLSIVTALFVWQFVNGSIVGSTTSIVDNQGILKKVYVPREIIPLSMVLSNLINFLLSLVVLVPLIFFYNLFTGHLPLLPFWILLLPFIIMLTVLLAAGLALLTSCLQVFFRDVRYIVEITLLVWFYFSGVFYSVDLVADKGIPWLTRLFMLNPLIDLFTMYRIVLLNLDVTEYCSTPILVLQTLGISLVIFFFSYRLFISKEHEMVDLI